MPHTDMNLVLRGLSSPLKTRTPSKVTWDKRHVQLHGRLEQILDYFHCLILCNQSVVGLSRLLARFYSSVTRAQPNPVHKSWRTSSPLSFSCHFHFNQKTLIINLAMVNHCISYLWSSSRRAWLYHRNQRKQRHPQQST